VNVFEVREHLVRDFDARHGRRRFAVVCELCHWICEEQAGRFQPVFCRAVTADADGRNGPRLRPQRAGAARKEADC
jgi:hypothetical protein